MSWLQDYGLVFDVVICLLLVTTIGYAMALNRRLADLRAARGEMEKLFADFTAATGQAEGGLRALKEGSGTAAEILSKNVGDACRLADEMAFLVKKGNEIADRLEVAIAASRKATQTAVPLQAAAQQPAGLGVVAGAGAAARPAMEPVKPQGPQGAAQGGPQEAAPARGIAKLVRRKLSGADSELMRTLQSIR
ncbi:MAG: DUF6468 domain-containing protein [Kiloniellaceae bacterium]